MMRVSLVVPCHNEAPCVRHFLETVRPVMESTGMSYEVIFVDDGSSDDTAAHVTTLCPQYPEARLIRLSRNFGKEAALTAGLQYAAGEAVIPMDCDLQDPPEAIVEMLAKWQEGFKVVLAVRRSRNADGWFKRKSAALFHALIRRISHVDIPANAGDFRLMDRAVVQAILRFPERNRFMKGIMAAAGFSTAVIEYDRPARKAGQTSFSAWKLWNFALDGITSFTTLPLRIWSYLGAGIAIFAIFYAAWTIFRTIYFGVVTPGHATLLTVILLLGAAILIGIGIQGEYIARLVAETKQRPLYIVESTQGFEDAEIRQVWPQNKAGNQPT
jgi:glycosyltransferase involved in cell wall biosynthesis